MECGKWESVRERGRLLSWPCPRFCPDRVGDALSLFVAIASILSSLAGKIPGRSHSIPLNV